MGLFDNATVVRARNFYNRNNVLFWCGGIFVFLHVFWWQIQQNPNLVPVEQRKRNIGPFKVYYLDELEYFKNKKSQQTNQETK